MGNCVSGTGTVSTGRGGGRAGRLDAAGAVPQEHLYTKPSGLYPACSWDTNMVRRLILRGELAPRFPGRDEAGVTDEDCPICMLAYPELNATKCCAGRICTECYLQIRPPRHNKEPCPFCKRKRVEAVLAPRPADHHVLVRARENERSLEGINGMHGDPGAAVFRHAADSAPSLSDASPSTLLSNCSTAATTVTTTAATAGTTAAHVVPGLVVANDDVTDAADSFITSNSITTTTTVATTAAANAVIPPACTAVAVAADPRQVGSATVSSSSEPPRCPHARCPPHHAHLTQHQLDPSSATPFYVDPPPSRPDPLLLEAMATELPPSVRSSDRASFSASASASASASPASSSHKLEAATLHHSSSSRLSDQFNPCPSCLHCNHARTIFPSHHHFVP